MAEDKGYIKLRNRIILRSTLFGTLILVGFISLIVIEFCVPYRLSSEGALGDAARALMMIAVGDAFAFLCALGAVYILLGTAAMLIRSITSSVKVYKLINDPHNPWLKPDKRPQKLLLKCTLIYTLVLAGAVAVSLIPFCRANSFMSTDSSEVGVGHIRSSLFYVMLDGDKGSTRTEYFSSFETGHSGVKLLDKLGTSEPHYYLTASDGKKIPLTVLDRMVLSKLFEKYDSQKNNLLKVEYYKLSGVIKSYEFVSDRRDIRDFDKPKVSLTAGEGFSVTRPADMADYGDIAWAVKRDNELLLPENAPKDRPYSVSAMEADTLKLSEHPEILGDDMRGEYTVELVKVFSYPDPEDNDTPDEEAVAVSDEVTFTISRAEDVFKALGGQKITLGVDEKTFKVTMPKLPEGYAKYMDIYIAAEMTGRWVPSVYGDDSHTESFSYTEGGNCELPEHSAHYRVYAYAADENGGTVPISDITEFDYLSKEDKEREEKREKALEYFEPVLQALEKHDTKAIKAMLSRYITEHNPDLDEKTEKLCSLFGGGTIDREAILYPALQHFEDEQGRYSEDYGDLWITTDTGGEYHLWMQTCYVNKNNKSNVGVIYLSLQDSKSYEECTIN